MDGQGLGRDGGDGQDDFRDGGKVEIGGVLEWGREG